MAYDRELADRVRATLAGEPAVAEQPMFGGLAFLVDGAMAVAVSGRGGLLVRCDPARADELIATEGAERAVMRGRELASWLRVPADAVADDTSLRRWVTIGRDVARHGPHADAG